MANVSFRWMQQHPGAVHLNISGRILCCWVVSDIFWESRELMGGRTSHNWANPLFTFSEQFVEWDGGKSRLITARNPVSHYPVLVWDGWICFAWTVGTVWWVGSVIKPWHLRGIWSAFRRSSDDACICNKSTTGETSSSTNRSQSSRLELWEPNGL